MEQCQKVVEGEKHGEIYLSPLLLVAIQICGG